MAARALDCAAAGRGGGPLALLNGLLALATALPLLVGGLPAIFVSGALVGAVFLSVVASTTALVGCGGASPLPPPQAARPRAVRRALTSGSWMTLRSAAASRARCGAGTRLFRAGWGRQCDACSTEHFPRVDPVVIMIVQYPYQRDNISTPRQRIIDETAACH